MRMCFLLWCGWVFLVGCMCMCCVFLPLCVCVGPFFNFFGGLGGEGEGNVLSSKLDRKVTSVKAV